MRGKMLSRSENTMSSRIPSQNTGIERPSNAMMRSG
jgi:hypothetical protein